MTDWLRNLTWSCAAVLLACSGQLLLAADQPLPPKKVVLIAGPITGHPKYAHEYEKSVILLKHLLDNCPTVKGWQIEAHFHGWPDDPRTLDTADTIVMLSDGGDHREADHPLYVGDRLEVLARQMQRGCGLIQFHWSTFHPSRVHEQITEWVGGYFDFQNGPPPRNWYSAIQTWNAPTTLGTPEHPISRGVQPFTVREEFYYQIRFRENDPRVKPILLTRPPNVATDQAVGWAVERKDGGRGFGFTGGHFYSNWWLPDFRKLILNAIVWTAGADVPAAGIETELEAPYHILIVTGHNHPAHDWRKVTAALIPVLEQDPRVHVEVIEDPEELAGDDLPRFQAVVMNYSSWDRPGLSAEGRKGLVNYLAQGGGLVILHFANGSFTDTLPNKTADWPEYRTKIVSRIWDHTPGTSGHDSYGKFQVQITAAGSKHPITAGLEDFETEDELYFRQQGTLPIIPLATAHSKVTGADEPMAWAYKYNEARVFQTVLGHADVSVRKAGALIRRGTAWAAGQTPLSFDPPVSLTENYLFREGSPWTLEGALQRAGLSPAAGRPANPQPLVEGKFDKALNAKSGGALVEGRKEFREPPLTFECWTRLGNPQPYNILAANELKSSATHWELFTMAGSGELTVYLPGYKPDHVRSSVKVCDNEWHYVGVTLSATQVTLYVEGKQVAQQDVEFQKGTSVAGPFSIGALVDQVIGCDGLIDEARVSRGIHPLTKVPTAPLEVEEDTLALWHFDEQDDQKRLRDASPTKAHAVVDADGVKKKSIPLRKPLTISARKPSVSNGPKGTPATTAGG